MKLDQEVVKGFNKNIQDTKRIRSQLEKVSIVREEQLELFENNATTIAGVKDAIGTLENDVEEGLIKSGVKKRPEKIEEEDLSQTYDELLRPTFLETETSVPIHNEGLNKTEIKTINRQRRNPNKVIDRSKSVLKPEFLSTDTKVDVNTEKKEIINVENVNKEHSRAERIINIDDIDVIQLSTETELDLTLEKPEEIETTQGNLKEVERNREFTIEDYLNI